MIIITGASRGIGNYLYNKYTELGCDVIGFYNNTQPSKHADNLFPMDITNIEMIHSFVKSFPRDLNNIVLLNCAGINYNAFAHKSDLSAWAKVISVNLIGTFNIINTVLPLMRDQNYGRIINFSSIVAQKGIAGTSAYAASKSGLWGMVKAIAVENASKGITINNLVLGYFDIGMISEVPEEIRNNIKQNIPGKKFGNPKDIFNTINCLVESSYINGANLNINGGLI